MRERLAKEGLGEDELVTVWGPDGSPLMVSKATIAEGLPAGVTEIQVSPRCSRASSGIVTDGVRSDLAIEPTRTLGRHYECDRSTTQRKHKRAGDHV